MHDLLIVGGGPAGLAVALGASKAGFDVVIYERHHGPIDKACGEGLMPGALRALQDLGVDPPGHDIRGITYRQGLAVAESTFRNGPGRGVRRSLLHEALRAAVDERRIPVIRSTIAGFEQHHDHVEAAGTRARYLVAADGLHSPIRNAAGLAKSGNHAPRWGLRRHFAVAPWTDNVEVTWTDTSEAYVTPISADTIGVAILSSVRGSFDDHLAAFPELTDHLTQASPISDVRGAGPLRQLATRRVAGRVLLVGDAAGYIDALTGEGLALSFAAAAQLVRCLATDRPDTYDRAWSSVSRRSRWITTGLLWTRHNPALARRVVPLAARAPRLFNIAVNQLAR